MILLSLLLLDRYSLIGEKTIQWFHYTVLFWDALIQWRIPLFVRYVVKLNPIAKNNYVTVLNEMIAQTLRCVVCFNVIVLDQVCFERLVWGHHRAASSKHEGLPSFPAICISPVCMDQLEICCSVPGRGTQTKERDEAKILIWGGVLNSLACHSHIWPLTSHPYKAGTEHARFSLDQGGW